MESEYTKQANDFLESAGATFETKFLYHGPYFDEDKENRDVYEITLKRGDKSYSFKFGQSVAAKNKKPTAYDVLAGITKRDPETFEDFCANYGYNTDSRTDEKIYIAVVKEWVNINRMFGDVLEQLQEIA